MAYMYEFDHSNAGVLVTLADKHVPELLDFQYDTHAPYDALSTEPVVMLNCFRGPMDKRPAVTTVAHRTVSCLEFLTALPELVTTFKIGEELKQVSTEKPVYGIAVKAEPDTTSVSLYTLTAEHAQLTNGSSKEALLVGINGLVFAVQEKLIRLRGAGHDFKHPFRANY